MNKQVVETLRGILAGMKERGDAVSEVEALIFAHETAFFDALDRAIPIEQTDEEWLNMRYQVYVPGADGYFHVADDNGGTLCKKAMGDTHPDCICEMCEEIKNDLLR